MHVLARSSSCATRLLSPNPCSERSSTTTRTDTVGYAALRSHQQQLEERRRECTPQDDAALRLQRLPCNAVKLHVPGRLVELKQQLQLPHRKARAHCCVDQVLVRHMIESFQQVTRELPPRARPPLPIHSMLPAPRHTARRHAPEWPRRSPLCSWPPTSWPRFAEACTAHARWQ